MLIRSFPTSPNLNSNPKKTEFTDLPEVLKLYNSDIKRVDKTKSLGVIVDEKVNWEEQFKRTKDKMSGSLAALKTIEKYHSTVSSM